MCRRRFGSALSGVVVAGLGLRLGSGFGWSGHYCNGPCLGPMPLHPGFVFRPAFLQRLATASDLQELFPAAAANPATFADGFEVFWMSCLTSQRMAAIFSERL